MAVCVLPPLRVVTSGREKIAPYPLRGVCGESGGAQRGGAQRGGGELARCGAIEGRHNM